MVSIGSELAVRHLEHLARGKSPERSLFALMPVCENRQGCELEGLIDGICEISIQEEINYTEIAKLQGMPSVLEFRTHLSKCRDCCSKWMDALVFRRQMLLDSTVDIADHLKPYCTPIRDKTDDFYSHLELQRAKHKIRMRGFLVKGLELEIRRLQPYLNDG